VGCIYHHVCSEILKIETEANYPPESAACILRKLARSSIGVLPIAAKAAWPSALQGRATPASFPGERALIHAAKPHPCRPLTSGPAGMRAGRGHRRSRSTGMQGTSDPGMAGRAASPANPPSSETFFIRFANYND